MPSQPSRFRQLALLTTIPMTLLAGPVVGFFLGDFLDRRWGTPPWLMVFFSIVGGISSVRETLHLIQRATKEAASDTPVKSEKPKDEWDSN